MTECLFVDRREARFPLCGNAPVQIQRRHHCTPRQATGHLLDLAPSGAKIEMDLPLPLEECVTLSFRFGALALNFTVDAQIRWVRPAKDDLWWMGCSFAPNLPADYLASLAGEGCLDRRLEPRRSVDFAATARFELAGAQRIEVQISDLSSGGVGLRSPQTAPPGERVLIECAAPGGEQFSVPTRCQWQVEEDEGFVLGCSFIDARGFARLAEAVRLAENAHAMPSAPRRGWLWPFLRP